MGELTHHIARNIDEFLSLIRSALSIKAAFSLIEDQFLHATHLCIICSCWHEFSLAQPPVFLGTVTFVEFGSNVLAGMWHDDTEEVNIPSKRAVNCYVRLLRSKALRCLLKKFRQLIAESLQLIAAARHKHTCLPKALMKPLRPFG